MAAAQTGSAGIVLVIGPAEIGHAVDSAGTVLAVGSAAENPHTVLVPVDRCCSFGCQIGALEQLEGSAAGCFAGQSSCSAQNVQKLVWHSWTADRAIAEGYCSYFVVAELVDPTVLVGSEG